MTEENSQGSVNPLAASLPHEIAHDSVVKVLGGFLLNDTEKHQRIPCADEDVEKALYTGEHIDWEKAYFKLKASIL